MTDTIRVDRCRETLLVTLQERDANPGLTRADLDAFPACIREASTDKGLKFLVISGAGEVFCRGGSMALIDEMADTPAPNRPAYVARVQQVVWCVLESPLCTVACVNGLAAGPGADLALACDITLAGPSARVNMWYNRVGLVPDLGFFLLADVLGTKAALRAYADSVMWDAGALAARTLAEPIESIPADAAGWQAMLGRRHRHLREPYAAAKRVRLEASRDRWHTELELAQREQAVLLGAPDLKDRLRRIAAVQHMPQRPPASNSIAVTT